MSRATFNDIARELRAIASNYPVYTPLREPQLITIIDGLTIRCIADSAAINAVADKYDKAARWAAPYRRKKWNDRPTKIAVGRIAKTKTKTKKENT
jgi:hypothetical protein